MREEMLAGASVDHLYHQLEAHQAVFEARLNELKDFNTAEAANKGKADRAKKLDEERGKLLAMPREELIKTAIGNKAAIEIKDSTTVAEIVDAILKTAPENI
jgi:hypothetical protein